MASPRGVLDEKGAELIASYKGIAAKLKKWGGLFDCNWAFPPIKLDDLWRNLM